MMQHGVSKKTSTLRGDGINIFVLINHHDALKNFVTCITDNLPNVTILNPLDFDYEGKNPPLVPVHMVFFCDHFPRFYGLFPIERLIKYCPEAKRIYIALEPIYPDIQKAEHFINIFNPHKVISPDIEPLDLGLLLLDLIRS